MIKTITIMDNEDGTQKIFLNNFQCNGSEITIDRAEFLFVVNQDQHHNLGCSAEINLHIKCLTNKNDELYRMYVSEKDMSLLSNKDLLTELKNRKVLKEEIVYKVTP
ncbi:MAG TPA: hypothetical protein VIM70_06085 [Clostridium sp.]|uniref:hypothetical protein n=1 Tax=Clostridium sp. TaxID=1506 RepID=UPI002F951BE3